MYQLSLASRVLRGTVCSSLAGRAGPQFGTLALLSNHALLLAAPPHPLTMSQPTPPPFFTWVSSNLAAHGMPSWPDQMRYLADNGIKYLVSLTSECRPPIEATPSITWVPIGIDDFHPPTLEQVMEFMRVVEEAEEKNEAVSVHCMRGRGRTGTMIACYFIKKHKMSAAEAIAEVRHKRPGSVETVEQEDLIQDYFTFINKPSI